MKKELQIGVLFTVAIGMLIAFSFSISQCNLLNHHDDLEIIFGAVSGLKEGDEVQVSGLQLGKVYELILQPDTKIKVVARMNDEVKLWSDYQIEVRKLSALGGTILYIEQGTPGNLRIDLAKPLTGTINLGGIDAIGDVLSTNKENLTELLESAKNTLKEIEHGDGNLSQLIHDKDLYINLEASSESLKNILNELETGTGTLSQLLNDRAIYDNVRDASSSLKNILEEIESGGGILGKAIYDKKLAQQISDAGDAITKVFEPVVRTQVFAGVESKYYAQSNMSISKFYLKIYPRPTRYFLVGGSVLSLDRDGDIDFEKKSEGDEYQTFLKADVQLAYSLGKDTMFRIGLLESKFGGGIDIEMPLSSTFCSKIAFTIEGRDAYNSVDDEKIDENISGGVWRAYGSARIWKYFTVFAGFSRLGKGPNMESMFGLAFEYKDDDIKSLVSLIGLSQ